MSSGKTLTATGMATFFGAKKASLFSQYRRQDETAVLVEPVERDVVEHIVPRQALRLTVEDPRDEREAACIMVEYPCRQADR